MSDATDCYKALHELTPSQSLALEAIDGGKPTPRPPRQPVSIGRQRGGGFVIPSSSPAPPRSTNGGPAATFLLPGAVRCS